MMRARVPLLLLGILFLASLSASFATSLREEEESQDNPFYFNSDNSWNTLFKNQYGHIRVLQRFDQQSKRLQNLEDYRLVEFRSKPETLLLPQQADAELLLVVRSGSALLVLVKPDDRREYFFLTSDNPIFSDHQKIPAGTIFYLVNPDPKEDLRIIHLAMPVNNHQIHDFFLSSTEAQQSYLQEFSKHIPEASFNSKFEEINRVLFAEEGQQEGVIVNIDSEQIEELSKHAKSSSRKSLSKQDNTIGNEFGNLTERTDNSLNVLISSMEMKEGALFVPHYYSKAIVILVVNEGEAHVELVGPKGNKETLEFESYRAELSKDDVFVIPAAYPVAIKATSNVNFTGFGINANNNNRNLLAGKTDNVISSIGRALDGKDVLGLTFSGSGEEVMKLINKQSGSYFVDGHHHQQEQQKGSHQQEQQKGRKGAFVY
uniref:Alpha-phaseolin n=1 Tax=Phaseolus vulgaris TaxID=3885 RepID=X5D3J1_PHAVU|nr:alpha-phaseolin [Phaseolus vulgaris]